MESTHQSVAPSKEPVTLTEAKMQCRYTDTDEDEYITNLIEAARQTVETITGRQLITATWVLLLDEFPDVIRLPYPPAQKVNSIKYYDTAGVQQTITPTDYRLDIYPAIGRIEPAYGKVWPTPRSQSATIEVDYDAGYGATSSTVPRALRQAILFLVNHWFLRREPSVIGRALTLSEVPDTIDRLLWNHKVLEFA